MSRWCIEPMHLITNLARSRLWHWLTFGCTVVLLFGNVVQLLWCPKTMDLFFDILFTITFFFLMLDWLLHILVDPNYFHFYSPLFPCCCLTKEDCCCYEEYSGGSSAGSLGNGDEEKKKRKSVCCQFGSFLFWFDLISTVSILPEISYLRLFAELHEMVRVQVDLYAAFIPEENAPLKVVANEGYVQGLLNIGRVARLAKFVRAATNFSWIPRSLMQFLCNRNNKCNTNTRPNEATNTTPTPQTKSPPLRASVFGQTLYEMSSELFSRKASEKVQRDHSALKIQKWWRTIKTNERRKQQQQQKQRLNQSQTQQKTSKAKSRFSSVISSTKTMIRRSNSFSKKKRRSEKSQVGTAMRELTSQRVVLGIMFALVLSSLLNYSEFDGSYVKTMTVLHEQTKNALYSNLALELARSSSVPELYSYTFANGSDVAFPIEGLHPNNLRENEKLRIQVTEITTTNQVTTIGEFSIRSRVYYMSLNELMVLLFILLVFVLSVKAFSGPVMSLVVIPIERMIRLLSMLTRDPLGYQSTPKFKNFIADEGNIAKTTRWDEEVLKGMETTFLMDTILRIGSLMKVGFGTAGIEIIRDNLQTGNESILFLNQRGTKVRCIFLFCDIRQFTDATESLQEEVSVYTNKIASVVHSVCNSYGGSANKNVGDAFLLSWPLDEVAVKSLDTSDKEMGANNNHYRERSRAWGSSFKSNDDTLITRRDQADRCLISVVKICIALSNDSFVINSLSELAKEKLLEKIPRQHGSCIRMGFGLHAGTAVQGAIGTERKLDALHIAESVEISEMLEGATKKYGLKLLMSHHFHDLLSKSTSRRCRKIDQLLMNADNAKNDENNDIGEISEDDIMELYTFDFDAEALHLSAENNSAGNKGKKSSAVHKETSRKTVNRTMSKARKTSFVGALNLTFANVDADKEDADESTHHGSIAPNLLSSTQKLSNNSNITEPNNNNASQQQPTGSPAIYHPSVWTNDEMRRMRNKYTEGFPFFQTFNSGLQSFYSSDWDHAKQSFASILERFEDGPSRYFVGKIEEHNGIPPSRFVPYGLPE